MKLKNIEEHWRTLKAELDQRSEEGDEAQQAASGHDRAFSHVTAFPANSL